MEKLGVSPSLLGFGCMRFPETPEGKIDREKATPMLEAAYDAGVTYFDTAYVYHNGESEAFLGDVLSKNRDHLILSQLNCLSAGSKKRKTYSEFSTNSSSDSKPTISIFIFSMP